MIDVLQNGLERGKIRMDMGAEGYFKRRYPLMLFRMTVAVVGQAPWNSADT